MDSREDGAVPFIVRWKRLISKKGQVGNKKEHGNDKAVYFESVQNEIKGERNRKKDQERYMSPADLS
jgi:hypothetical protein